MRFNITISCWRFQEPKNCDIKQITIILSILYLCMACFLKKKVFFWRNFACFRETFEWSLLWLKKLQLYASYAGRRNKDLAVAQEKELPRMYNESIYLQGFGMQGLHGLQSFLVKPRVHFANGQRIKELDTLFQHFMIQISTHLAFCTHAKVASSLGSRTSAKHSS